MIYSKKNTQNKEHNEIVFDFFPWFCSVGLKCL